MTSTLNRPLIFSARALSYEPPDATDGRSNFSFCQPFSVFDQQILGSAIRVMHQLALSWRVLINGLFQRVQHEACIRGAAGAPTNNPPCINIVDEGHIHKALPCRDIGEVADLEHVWRWRMELAVHLVQGARQRLIWERCLWLLAAHNTFDPNGLPLLGLFGRGAAPLSCAISYHPHSMLAHFL
jgi:hypothetical protein